VPGFPGPELSSGKIGGKEESFKATSQRVR